MMNETISLPVSEQHTYFPEKIFPLFLVMLRFSGVRYSSFSSVRKSRVSMLFADVNLISETEECAKPLYDKG